MTSKERAQLRGMANTLEPLFQVGKYGVTDAVVNQLEEAFKTRELLKLKVLLESAPETPQEIAQKLAEATDAQVVQVIGGSMVFYKENTGDSEKKPVKKPATKAQRAKAKRVALSLKKRSKNTAERKDRIKSKKKSQKTSGKK